MSHAARLLPRHALQCISTWAGAAGGASLTITLLPASTISTISSANHSCGSTATTAWHQGACLMQRPYSAAAQDAVSAAPDTAQTTGASRPSAPTSGAELQGQQCMLMRDFIQNSLYHPTRGYFNRPFPVVGTLPQPINFWNVATRDEWERLLARTYKQLGTAWLTPAEMFSPHYGNILARHITEHRKYNLHQEGQPLDIIEVGGGNGTLARDILNWLRKERPQEYAVTSYTCLEISSRLASEQYKAVVEKHGHSGRFRVVQGNAWDSSTWGSRPDYGHCTIIMMEVLDNLPHDKVRRLHPEQPWQQSMIQVAEPAAAGQSSWGGRPSMADGPWEEVWQPATDPLLLRALRATYQPVKWEAKLDAKLNKIIDFLLAQAPEPELPDGELLYVPTACLALMDILHHMRPNHSLILADVDALPGVKLPGRNAPLVAQKVGGENRDYDTVLVPWGTADIFFPTDFDALGKLYTASAEYVYGQDDPGKLLYAHYQQGAVMKRYKEMVNTATLLSFNPLVNSFTNMRFFLGDALGRVAMQPALAPQLPAEHVQQQQQAAAGAPSAPWSLPQPPGQPLVPNLESTLAGAAATAAATPTTVAPATTNPAAAGMTVAAAADTIDFAWQYGHGKGMQHAAIQRSRRTLGRSGAKGRAATQPPQQQPTAQGRVLAPGAAHSTAVPGSKGRVTPQQQQQQADEQEGPILGGRHLRLKKGAAGAASQSLAEQMPVATDPAAATGNT